MALCRANRGGASDRGIIVIVLIVAAIGVANAYVPTLAALRDNVRLAQPAMILGLTAGLLIAGLGGRGRAYFRTADLGPLIGLHGWRVLFGVLLLIVGLNGGLPANFFWSIALGDILAGFWALSLWRRSNAASAAELKLWSAFGLLDLLHLLPRAILTLPPFYAAHPELFRPALLPLLGVPMLIALHMLLIIRVFADAKSIGGSFPQPHS